LDLAKANSQGKDIRIQGGANIIQQYLNAGLVDDFTVHIAPVFLGSGIRLFDNIDKSKVRVEVVEAISSALATHLSYKVTKKQ
jgi:dihydrofolate reductase